MRRIVLALLATTMGATLLVGIKARGGPLDPTVAATTDLGAGDGAPGTVTSAGPGETPGPGPTGPPSSTPAAVNGSATTTRPPAGGSATTTAPAPPARRTLTGTAVGAKGYGSMQVQIVVSGKHIDSIATIRQSNRPKGTATTLTPLALSAQAVPTVTCRTTVSGATYSCDAWLQSLRSAISQV